MDRKTLEYMEERAGKARQIVDRIERLKQQIKLLKTSRGSLDLYTSSVTIRLETNRVTERAENNYATWAVAAIHNTYIDVALAEIKHLENVLAEL